MASKKLEEIKMTPAEKIMALRICLHYFCYGYIRIKYRNWCNFSWFYRSFNLLISGVITVKDMMDQKGAWSLIVWLSIVMLMSQKLMK